MILQTSLQDDNHTSASIRKPILKWFGIYIALVLISSALFAFVIPALPASKPLQKESEADRGFRVNLESAYTEGDLGNVLCPSSSLKPRSPEKTRRILDESGLMDSTARVVSTYGGFSGGCTTTYEPEHARRPSIVITNDGAVFINRQTRVPWQKCIVSIIE